MSQDPDLDYEYLFETNVFSISYLTWRMVLSTPSVRGSRKRFPPLLLPEGPSPQSSGSCNDRKVLATIKSYVLDPRLQITDLDP